MKVLLLYPEFPDTFWSFKHALEFVRKRASYPPLGLLTVAAMLPREWELRLVDQNVASLKDADLEWADIAFIGGMVVQRASALETVRRCRAAGLRIVAGGPLFTTEPETFPEVDHLVLGEAELTLPLFLRDLAAGKAGRVYRDEGFADVSTTPVPRWDLVNHRHYASMSIQYSRGCPFDCEFCNVTALFGHRPRVKSTEQIIAELDCLWEMGWRGNVFFVDDNLIGHKKNLKNELLPALVEWQHEKRRVPFCTEASINLADDPALLSLMAAAGFDAVFIGIETPSEESLSECSKNQNRNRDLVEDVKRIQRAGIQVQAGFIVGFDHDSESIFERQIEFIQRSGIVTAMVGLLQAPLGTKLYERMRSQGRLLGRTSGDNVDGTTNIVPKMSLETLQDGYKRLLRHIYAPKHCYARIRTFLRETQPPKVRARLKREDLQAVFRSSYRLGIFGRERFEYWKLLIWTLFKRPRLLPLAVTLSIYGHHFRRVSELHVV
jgi:radical SAM superfamily enzyme YgiQ (UPF0313 family)